MTVGDRIPDRAPPARESRPSRGVPPRGAALHAVAARVGCSPAEVLALGVLVAGAAAALGLLWVLARPGVGNLGGASPGAGDAAAVTIDGTASPGPGRSPGGSPGAAGEASVGLAAEAGVEHAVASAPADVVVHVAGHVVAPGVHRLPVGSRVGDALDLAGGPLPDAALDAVNLARPLVDGEQVVVPGQGDPAPTPAAGAPSAGPSPGGSPPPGQGARRADGTLDLNLATAEELDELPGVGPVLAERILEHRTAVGRFGSVGELRDVTGIGERTFQDLADLVSV